MNLKSENKFSFTRESDDIIEKIINVLSITCEICEPYTSFHQKNVTRISIAIAEELGHENEFIQVLTMAAMFHDIGKIAIPCDILNKTSVLTDDEYELIKTHPSIGWRILKSINLPFPVAEAAIQHHERMDGSGYPFALSGEKIFIHARIIAVADVFDAMYSNRPYRPSLGFDAAFNEIWEGKGKLYDSDVVDAFSSIIYKGSINSLLGIKMWSLGEVNCAKEAVSFYIN
ncbi:HD-GYP domain-containing protein [Spirochaetota bacterium]